jgi:hypothetical protein
MKIGPSFQQLYEKTYNIRAMLQNVIIFDSVQFVHVVEHQNSFKGGRCVTQLIFLAVS